MKLAYLTNNFLCINQITTLSLLVGFLSGLFFIPGSKLFNLIAAVLLHLHYLFDHVDGQIARYRRSASITGRYYDHLILPLLHPYIFACLTFGLFNNIYRIFVFLFGFSASLFAFFSYFIVEAKYRVLIDHYKRQNKKSETSKLNRGSTQKDCPTEIRPNSVLHLLGKKLLATMDVLVYFPTFMYSITIFVIVDLFLKSTLQLFGYSINLVYLPLIFYSVIFPFNCIMRIHLELSQGIEKEYIKIFNR